MVTSLKVKGLYPKIKQEVANKQDHELHRTPRQSLSMIRPAHAPAQQLVETTKCMEEGPMILRMVNTV